MSNFMEEIPVLVVTILLILLVAALLLTGVATINNPFVDVLTGIIVPFWYLRSAYQWQPKAPPPPPQNTTTAPAPVDTAKPS